MNRKLIELTFLLSLTTLASCGNISSESVDPDEINTRYSAQYSDDDRHLSVTGTFTLDHDTTYVSLDSPSVFRVNGKVAKENNDLFNQIDYTYEKFNVSYESINLLKLEYINRDSVMYQNIIKIPSKVDVSKIEYDSISKSLVIGWDVLNNNDSATEMSIYVTDDQKHLSKVISTDISRGEISLSKEEIQQFVGGKPDISICRTRRYRSFERPNLGGRMESIYCSKRHSKSLR